MWSVFLEQTFSVRYLGFWDTDKDTTLTRIKMNININIEICKAWDEDGHSYIMSGIFFPHLYNFRPKCYVIRRCTRVQTHCNSSIIYELECHGIKVCTFLFLSWMEWDNNTSNLKLMGFHKSLKTGYDLWTLLLIIIKRERVWGLERVRTDGNLLRNTVIK